MRHRDDIETLAAVFGPRVPVEDNHQLRQRNVRIRGYTDSVLENLARTSDLPFQTMVNLVLSAGLQALEDRMGTEAFERAADFTYGEDENGEDVRGPRIPDEMAEEAA